MRPGDTFDDTPADMDALARIAYGPDARVVPAPPPAVFGLYELRQGDRVQETVPAVWLSYYLRRRIETRGVFPGQELLARTWGRPDIAQFDRT